MIIPSTTRIAWITLGKPWVALLVAASTVAGSILTGHWQVMSLFLVASGTFLMAAGASGFNQIQERNRDGLMTRTAGRPIPSGCMSLQTAIVISMVALLTGIGVLLLLPTSTPVFLGLAALVIYNGIYTPLKTVTAFAAVPGLSSERSLPPWAGPQLMEV